jgi:protein-L-isoaspartate O-methyltransferase
MPAEREDVMVQGTRGYAEHANELIARYESVAFEQKHAPILALLPIAPTEVLEVGAGTGVDAAWLAARGHRVLAVEPTTAFREAGQVLHPSPAIDWLNDSLPELSAVRARNRQFGLIMLTAVWMHLPPEQRPVGMGALASLLAPGGILVISLRHGPVPAGRCMFEVAADETIAQARSHGLASSVNVETESSHPANVADGVTWTCLAFRAPDSPAVSAPRSAIVKT